MAERLAECFRNDRYHKLFRMWPEGVGIRAQVDIDARYCIPVASWSFSVITWQDKKKTDVYSPGVDGLNISHHSPMESDMGLDMAFDIYHKVSKILDGKE